MSFPYFNHGVGSLNDSLDFYVWFEDDPSRARKKLTSALNWPDGMRLVGPKDWCGHHVHAYEAYGKYDGFGAHVSRTDEYMRAKAPEGFEALGAWAKLDADTRKLVGFEAALDEHLQRIHDDHPIAFVFRGRERGTRTARHDESLPFMDDALDAVREHLDVSTKTVGPLASTLRLYDDMLSLRCGKHGGKTMPKSKRRVHLDALLEHIDAREPWDTLKVAFKLKAAPPAEVIASLSKPTRKTVWKSAKNYQGDGKGAYSAAVFKLPKPAFAALQNELG